MHWQASRVNRTNSRMEWSLVIYHPKRNRIDVLLIHDFKQAFYPTQTALIATVSIVMARRIDKRQLPFVFAFGVEFSHLI